MNISNSRLAVMLSRTILLVVIVLALFAIFAFAAPQTFTGTVTGAMCGTKHMIAGKSAAECTRECMKSKGDWSYGLVVGDKVYSLAGDAKQFGANAGKRVKVGGEVTGNKIAVKSITPAQ
jgi:hypothetical protein